MKKTVQPPKGFRDFYGPEARLRSQVVNVFESVFQKYGYEPLETPALEYAETILGKYGEEAEKLVYQLKDSGGRSLAMRYEMTASACRFVAQNQNKLVFPFRRYQIQKAWRAEKPQRGRFREFLQCDADVWGTKSVAVDAEFIEMGTIVMLQLGFKEFTTRINNRKIINAMIEFAGAKKEQIYDITIAIDKLKKIGLSGVKKELKKREIANSVIEKVLQIISLEGESKNLLKRVKLLIKDYPEGVAGIEELEQMFDILASSGLGKQFFAFDPSIARGLAYYTGPVWETEIAEGNIGSVSGCGRYDTLTKMIAGIDIPASGGSFGIERLCQVLGEREIISVPKTVVRALATIFSPSLADQSRAIARKLRKAGIATEVYIDPKEKMSKQISYANKKGIPWVIILGPDEVKEKKLMLKNMATGKQEKISLEEAIKQLQ